MAVLPKSELLLLNDPQWKILEKIKPDVVVDAILAKKNLGTNENEAELVIGLGPGFSAGKDVHLVIETNRGHHLGRIIASGAAEPNTGIPGSIGGYAAERVLRAPAGGKFNAQKKIGDKVKKDDVVGLVEKEKVNAGIGGILRGLIRSGNNVSKGLKLGDIEPRGEGSYAQHPPLEHLHDPDARFHAEDLAYSGCPFCGLHAVSFSEH